MLPDSFQPYYLGKSTGGVLNLATSGTTAGLINTPGLIGLFNTPLATGVYGNAISTGTAASCIMAVGSWHTKDKLSPVWGGLLEPEYTQIIAWDKVIDFAKSTAVTAQNQVVSFGWDQSSGSSTGPLFYCGTSYNFYLELQGQAALSFLDHQFYSTMTAFAGCCGTDCSSGCNSTYVDAACVLLQWKDGFNQNPYWPTYINPQVFIKNGSSRTEVFSAYDTSIGVGTGTYVCNTADPASVVAGLQITVAYVATEFNTCTFSPSDYFNIEPLFVQGSLFNQNASPCSVNTTINTSVPNMFTQITGGRQPRGLGQQVVRNLLAWAAYRQEYFPDGQWSGSFRQREIENFTQLTDVNLQGYYDSIILRFNQTRPWNYSSITDQDAYCLTIYVPTGTTTTAFTNLVNACLTAAGSSVQLRTI